jgi:chemotaxis protein CheD
LENLVVGVGDGKVSRDVNHVLVTYALGSCIALAVWDPVTKVGGMLHFLLPEAGPDPVAAQNPCRYGDTGTPWLFRAVSDHGGHRPRLHVFLAGGASVVNDGGLFNIGKRNYTAIRRLLWKAGVPVHAEAVGGSVSRTVGLELATGRFWIREPGVPPRDLKGRTAMTGGTV